MATHSSILALEISRTEERGRLQSMGVTKELDTTERLRTTMTYTKEHLLYTSLASVYLLWWGICSSLWPIFKWKFSFSCWILRVLWLYESVLYQLCLCKYFLPDSGLGEGNGSPLQYSCLQNRMDRQSSLVDCSPWGHTVGHDWSDRADSGLAFHPLDVVFYRVDVFHLMKFSLWIISFLDSVFGFISKKSQYPKWSILC